MKRILLLVALLGCMAVTAAERPTHVYLIGDSTCANKQLDKENPERGWGQLFRAFFDEAVVVENHALNGRSTKSFREEGRWEPIYNGMQVGDYVFIQFGHNDEKIDRPKVGSVPEVFAENLRRYVRETREKGGIPDSDCSSSLYRGGGAEKDAWRLSRCNPSCGGGGAGAVA